MAEIRQDVLIRSQVLMTEKNPVITHLEKKEPSETPKRDLNLGAKENPSQVKSFQSTLHEISHPKKEDSSSKGKITPLVNDALTSKEDSLKKEKEALDLLQRQETGTAFKIDEAFLREKNAFAAEVLYEDGDTETTSNLTRIEVDLAKPNFSTLILQNKDSAISGEQAAQDAQADDEVKLENFSKASIYKMSNEDNPDQLQHQTADIEAPIAVEIKPILQPLNQEFPTAASPQVEIDIASEAITKKQPLKEAAQSDLNLLQELEANQLTNSPTSSFANEVTKNSPPKETYLKIQQSNTALIKKTELSKNEENNQQTLQPLKAMSIQQNSFDIQSLRPVPMPLPIQEMKPTTQVLSSRENLEEGEEISEIEGIELTQIEKTSGATKSLSAASTEYFEADTQESYQEIESLEIRQPEGSLNQKAQNIESKSFDLSAIDQQKMIDHIAEKFEKNVQVKNNSFEIQLNPEGLGQIHIELSFEEKSVKATFKSSETEALQFLQQHSGRIQEIFASHGFSSEQNSLSFSLQDSPQRGSQQGYQSDSQSYFGAAKDYEAPLTPAYQTRKAGYFNQNGTFAISV